MKYQINTPTSHTHFFQYQPEKIKVGTLYHYKRTNFDGKNQENISIYTASKNHIEVLKIGQNSEILDYKTEDINWDVFCPDHMVYWHIQANADLRQQAIASLSIKDHLFEMWVGESEFQIKVKHYPVYNNTFDFASLNFIFRHLINPLESFDIGIVEPNWDILQNPGSNSNERNPEPLFYRGRVQIDYLGDDLYKYHICRKYRMGGEGFGNQNGTIWVSKADGHFVNLELPPCANSAGNNLKIELQLIENMTAGEWNKFIHAGRSFNSEDLQKRKENIQAIDPIRLKSRIKDWTEDIDFFANKLESNHPYLYHDLRPAQFLHSVSRLKTHAHNFSDHRIIVELGKILSSIEDGHTSAFLGNDMLRMTTGFRKVPLVLQYFEDGLFVVAGRSEQEHCIGAKVIGIGNHSLDVVEQALIPLVSRSKKNKMKILQDLPDLMVTAEVLHALELCEDMEQITFKLDGGKGEIFSASFVPVAIERGPFTGIPLHHGTGDGWITACQKNQSLTPLYLSDKDNHYWSTYLEEFKIFYVQYNQAADKKEEPLSAFCQKVFEFLDHNRPEKFVVDIRFNPGGSGPLNWYLLREIINREWLNQKGTLFTIIGRGTFSAAIMAAVALERQTGTIFVGEPTGDSPNHFGESNMFTLPNSGVTMMHSSIYWQLSDPDDDRPSIEPGIPVKIFSRDFISGSDPALDAIIKRL
jgi:hypothetical protein